MMKDKANTLKIKDKQSVPSEVKNSRSPIEMYRDAMIKALEAMGATISLKGEEAKVEEALLEASNKIRLNELDQPMHPLEAEVEDMVNDALAGKQVVPPYDRSVNDNPVAYVQEHFAKYLDYFNGGQGDFLFMDQLGKIVPNKGFKSTLSKYLARNRYNSPIVQPLSVRLDRQAKELSPQQLEHSRKVNTLINRAK